MSGGVNKDHWQERLELPVFVREDDMGGSTGLSIVSGYTG